jgi:hypothetical protein
MCELPDTLTMAHPANLAERAGGHFILDVQGERFPRLQRI